MTVRLHDRASRVSEILIELNAIHCNADTPYILTSGWASPVYVNCRRIISATWQRREIMQMAAEMIEGDVGSKYFNVIAGGETAGIPFAAWLAEYFYKPMVYVRKKNKGFGLRRQIEGELPANPRALIVEYLMTDGASKIHFASSLRAAKAKVSHVFVVFNYGIYTNTAQLLEEANLSLWALTDWRTTLEVAKRLNYFNKKQIAVVERFLSDAAGWSKAHNGASL